ncbi:MAG: pantoate--beta-alanine ligase [Deltaproteobacteria bacterium]|nr:pantoate--beta-alanine ligase [Deltaproteobacteria bacterium]MBI3066636.1 pantoate--beta-alanine ligase [Deltaproteobacteria bacterium]
MQIIERVLEMQRWSESERRQGRRIALVPTMGALHEGHLSLVRDGKVRGDRVVVSLFVNPAQFAPQEDFASYPRDFERDRELLNDTGTDVLFHPAVEEIYPEGFETRIEIGELSKPLCGAVRPGHFSGVATVVATLFNIVRPHVAIFGCKDYQQLQIIRRLVRDLNFDIEVIGHPTVREGDGLAMSSRNAYLNPEERKAALCLYRSLRHAEEMVRRGERCGAAIVDAVRGEIAREPLARVEYATLCDSESLREVERVEEIALLALAVRIGKARLIDNIILKP